MGGTIHFLRFIYSIFPATLKYSFTISGETFTKCFGPLPLFCFLFYRTNSFINQFLSQNYYCRLTNYLLYQFLLQSYSFAVSGETLTKASSFSFSIEKHFLYCRATSSPCQGKPSQKLSLFHFLFRNVINIYCRTSSFPFSECFLYCRVTPSPCQGRPSQNLYLFRFLWRNVFYTGKLLLRRVRGNPHKSFPFSIEKYFLCCRATLLPCQGKPS